MGCAFCGYSRALARATRGETDAEEARRFGKVLADYQQRTGRRVLVSWLGGEPLLWRVFEEMSEYFARTLGLALSVTTNGSALGAPRVREMLAQCFSEVTVSVDGFADFHERVRDRPGSHAALRENVQALAAFGVKPLLRANTVLMRGNVADYPALCRELATWGFRELTFNQLGGDDRPEFYPKNRLLPGQVMGLTTALPALREELAARGVNLRGSPAYLRRIEATANGERLPVQDCGPGAQFLFVDERGMAAPCSFTTSGYGIPIGEIRDALDLIALPRRFSAMRTANRLAPCLDCQSTQIFEKFHAES